MLFQLFEYQQLVLRLSVSTVAMLKKNKEEIAQAQENCLKGLSVVNDCKYRSE